MVGIYKIMSPTNKVYIGQSWDIEKRVGSYRRGQCIGQHRILNSINKHGWEAHKFEVIFGLRGDTTQEWLDYWEIFFWQYYKESGYKMLNIKKPGSNGKHSEETKKKISLTAKNRLSVPENNNNYGKKASPETRLKISVGNKKWHSKNTSSRKGVPLSEEAKRKISEKAKIRLAIPENNPMYGRDRSGDKAPMFGKKLSEEAKLKMSIAKRKIVYQYNSYNIQIKEWASVNEAANVLGLNADCISQCATGRIKTAGGFIWKYKEKEVTCQ